MTKKIKIKNKTEKIKKIMVKERCSKLFSLENNLDKAVFIQFTTTVS